jgi:Cu(I)/Ag(I) efflux system membrane fusion protein
MKYRTILSVIAIAAAASLQAALDKYIQIQTALAGDSLKGVPEAAAEIASIAEASDGAVSVPAQAGVLAKAADIQAAREAFKPLSAALITALSSQKSISGQYYEAFCPMAKASWIQVGKMIANPYFGADMSGCGEIRKPLGGSPQANAAAAGGMGCCGS